MIRSILILYTIFTLAFPVKGMQIEAPPVPESGRLLMPRETDSFSEGLQELTENIMSILRPDLAQAVKTGAAVFSLSLILAVLSQLFSKDSFSLNIAGAAGVAILLLNQSGVLIRLAEETLQELNDYGKLFFPVMGTALAAQGGVQSSAVMYSATMILNTVLSQLLLKVMVPTVYCYLSISVAEAAFPEKAMKILCDGIKNGISWCLKTILTAYTTYISICGIVSGKADAAALKATKVTFSSFVPILGGILSDASEAVLLSAELLKSTAGIYGIFVFLSIFIGPFVKIAGHYLVLKATAFLCTLAGPERISCLIDRFTGAMGILLAMTGAFCLMILLSTICFLKGIS